MAQRWRLLLRMINASPSKVDMFVKTMCVLHNFLRTVNDPQYIPGGFADYVARDGTVQEGFWRAGRTFGADIAATQARHATAAANVIRNRFVDYLSSESGSVPWQLAYIRRRQ